MGSMILGLGLLLALIWVWTNRGFLSSMLHMVCTIAAGAVAFAVWEPLAQLIIGASPSKGMLSVGGYIGWGAALLLPFGLSLLLFRLITDTVVKSNVKPIAAVDYGGAAICGAVSGAITVGMIFIAQGYLPMAQRAQPVGYSQSGSGIGSLERRGGLWLPAERFTVALYEYLSIGSLRTGEPLAEWYPDLDISGYAITTSAAGGKARPSISRDDFRIVKTYTVGDTQTGSPTRELLVESTTADAAVQGYVNLEGEQVTTGSLLGVVVEFDEGAKEQNGQVVYGNGQTRLLMRDRDGEMTVAHPVALISQADSADAELYGRWLFDGEEVFIASVGGAAKATMAFEFVVPAGHQPVAISVKNTRVLLDGSPDDSYSTAGDRFAALSTGGLVGGSRVTDLDLADAVQESGAERFDRGETPTAVVVGNTLGFVFEVRQRGGLEIDESNRILRGSTTLRPEDINNRGADRNVLIDRIAVTPDVLIVRVDVSPNTAASVLGRAARSVDRVLPPQLIDTSGKVYPAVGYIYEDNEIVEVGYDPAQSIRGLASLPTPTISSSRRDQRLQLLFRVSKGVELDYYAIGQKVIVDIDPPLLLDMNQN